MSIFHVAFYNPQSHHLHSTATVDAENPPAAVKAALDHVQTTMRGTEINDLPTFQTSITDENHQPIVGFEKQMSKAQLVAELAKLQGQIDALNDDTPVAAVAPSPPVSTEVPLSAAPSGTATAKFTQADIDAAIAKAREQAKVGASA